MHQRITVLVRLFIVTVLVNLLSGCVYWRLYQTKLQMEDFDKKFAIAVDDNFTLFFHDPLIFSEDFIELAKLQPTQKENRIGSKRWRYVFRKVDKDNNLIKPEINFYWDLTFNEANRLKAWTLSSKFIEMAPPVFLEHFLRSLAGADVDTLNYRLKVDVDSMDKISAVLPTSEQIAEKLGEPLYKYVKKKDNMRVAVYRFILDSPDIEEGYESRAVTTLKLGFDLANDELISMKGRYAGLKIAINYKKLLNEA